MNMILVASDRNKRFIVAATLVMKACRMASRVAEESPNGSM
jgi:hypothetical protein